jgi:hypothetical protein
LIFFAALDDVSELLCLSFSSFKLKGTDALFQSKLPPLYEFCDMFGIAAGKHIFTLITLLLYHIQTDKSTQNTIILAFDARFPQILHPEYI